MVRLLASVVAFSSAASLVAGHSNLISPRPRNAVDIDLDPWNDTHWGPGTLPHNASCEHPITYNSSTQPAGRCWGCTCMNGTEPCAVGQTCAWFNQGCSIGCPHCDGLESNPNKKDRCNSGMKATNNDPYFRTYNKDIEALSKEDVFQWNPWRAPGSAPVYDACSMAGGGPKWIPTGLSYIDTIHAVQGDLGSKVLPKTPTGVVWEVGTEVETKWNVRANHGGGYQYRLCPADEPLTEACMQKTPIPFAGRTALEWANGSRLAIEGRFLSSPGMGDGPPLSDWAMNPLPYSDSTMDVQFQPPCNETVDRTRNDTGVCSGRFPWDVSIIDTLVVPNVPPGEYVMQLRWDCEATAQVWSHCADITIVAA